MTGSKFDCALLAFAGLNGAIAVAIGAWAAHGLETRIGATALQWVGTATSYQLWHALALIACVLLMPRLDSAIRLLQGAAICFALGELLFCGALYALAFGLPRWLGAVAPLGGLGFILGWLLLALAALLGRNRRA